MRTIIDLPDAAREALDALCRRDGISRAEAVRRAVATLVRLARASGPDPAFGLWRGRAVNGLAYERRLRQEWGKTAPKGRR